LKPSTSLIESGGAIVLPKQSTRVEYEAELAIVIGKRAKNVSRKDALDHVFGYTCACDVTARDLQRSDGQWSRAKGFDTFCPLGPHIETELDPKDLRIVCRVNGETKQDARTSGMIFDVPTLIEFMSASMTLEVGDVLLTGTPEGVGPIAPGDRVEVEIDGIGTLEALVEREARES
jgi:2-keto-4-pentenoate hydratase/2-oxohepta-3-ene-1,7-dioic acid hydratase in catechol pathway